MSKFADKIKRISTGAVAPMGFKKPVAQEDIPQILLVADLVKPGSKQVKEIHENGFDALLVNSVSSQEFSRLLKNPASLPIGIRLGDSFNYDISKLVEDGCDFIIFGLDAGINYMDSHNLGRILRVSNTLTPGMIKSINDLDMSIDCIFLENDKVKVDIDLLLTCHLYMDLTNKPLMIKISSGLTKTELNELNKAGIRALIVSFDVPVDVISKLRSDIRDLPRIVKPKTAGRPLVPILDTTIKKEEKEVEEEEEE